MFSEVPTVKLSRLRVSFVGWRSDNAIELGADLIAEQ